MHCRAVVDQQSARINHFLNLVSMASRYYSVDKFPVVHGVHIAWTKVNTVPANDRVSSTRLICGPFLDLTVRVAIHYTRTHGPC